MMTVELGGAHMLAPGFGTGLNAWTAMLVVALGGLALGAAAGGQLADRVTGRVPRVLGAVLALAALACCADVLAWERVVYGLAALGPRLGALAAAAVLFLPTFVFLGAVFPLALRGWVREMEAVGRRAGRLSAVSAAGSLIGGLAGGFLLIQVLAIETVFAGCAVLLLAAAAGGLLAARGWRVDGAALLVVALLPLCLPSRVLPPEVLFRRGSMFGPLEVRQSGDLRYLVVAGAVQGVGRFEPLGSAMPHTRLITGMLRRELPPDQGRVLVLGLGAGFMPRELAPIRCETVEIDPAVVEAAEQFFAFDRGRYPVHLADGRAFLLRLGERYDAVVVDALRGSDVPYHLVSRECFELIRGRLRRGGMVVVNFHGALGGAEARLVRSLERTLREVFPHVEIRADEQRPGWGNAVFAAHEFSGSVTWPNRPEYRPVRTFLDGRRGPVLTDSCNPAALWSACAHHYRP
jgi:spermidine synthase